MPLLGIEIATYRRRFNELNTFISLISMHQSNKDVLGLTDEKQRAKNLLYLSLCSDLLGIIGVITGYYSQENPSLLIQPPDRDHLPTLQQFEAQHPTQNPARDDRSARRRNRSPPRWNKRRRFQFSVFDFPWVWDIME